MLYLSSQFQWSDENQYLKAEGLYFEEAFFGSFILNRRRIVEEVLDATRTQQLSLPKETTSVYLSGCRGMGKTCDLFLIARELKERGWEVFFFDSADGIPYRAGHEIAAYARKNKHKRVAVLVDEVASKPTSHLFVTLLKGKLPNVLVVGAAVPRFLPTGHTAVFRKVLQTSDLVLREEDDDVHTLIAHWQDKHESNPQIVEYVCKYLLHHCGGHVFPILAIMEHFFTNSEAEPFLAGKKEFLKYFHSADFAQTEVYSNVIQRCFGSWEPGTLKAMSHVLAGRGESHDVEALYRLGWWDPETGEPLSTLLLNATLDQVPPVMRSGAVEYVDHNRSWQENLEQVIAVGLRNMEPRDLDHTGKIPDEPVEGEVIFGKVKHTWPVENALSFKWACQVKAHVPNVRVDFQKSFGSKCMDFLINGSINAGLEVIRNATRTLKEGTVGQKQDVDDHLERFLSGDYKVERFALLNFAMESRLKIALPKDANYHDKVYTYVHSTNSLYRGNELIRAPAVAKLPCASPLVHIEKGRSTKRNYCSAAQRLPASSPRFLIAGLTKVFK